MENQTTFTGEQTHKDVGKSIAGIKSNARIISYYDQIIGCFGGKRRPKVFPFRETNRKDIKQVNQPKHSNDRIYRPEGISPTINTMQGGNRQPFITHPTLTCAFARAGSSSEYMSSIKATKLAVDVYNKKLRTECHTLTDPGHNSIRVKDNRRIRKLTPIECERLQGFPDNWTEDLSDTQRYKTMGNAVTVNVIQAIAERLL